VENVVSIVIKKKNILIRKNSYLNIKENLNEKGNRKTMFVKTMLIITILIVTNYIISDYSSSLFGASPAPPPNTESMNFKTCTTAKCHDDK